MSTSSAKTTWKPDALHVLSLSSFALAQPLYDVLGRHPDFFLAHKSSGADLATLVLGVSFLIPAILFAGVAIVHRLHVTAGRCLERILTVLLVACIALPPATRGTDLDVSVGCGLALLLGILIAMAVERFEGCAMFFRWLSPAALIFPLYFAWFTPVMEAIGSDARSDLLPVESTQPVVFLLFDEFPLISLLDENSKIDSVRYPHLAALAQESYWFRNTTAVSDDTVAGAVGSILTGRYPGGLENTGGSLFDWLGASYELNVFEPYTNYCPEIWNDAYQPFTQRVRILLEDTAVVLGHIILPDPVAQRLPPIAHDWKNFGSAQNDASEVDPFLGDRMVIWRQFLKRIHAQAPQLSFLHLLMPHVPFAYMPGGETYLLETKDRLGIPALNMAEEWADDAFAIGQAHQRHLLQVGFLDGMVGQLVRRLKDLGIYEKTLLVITADHGASYRQGQLRRPVRRESEFEILPVPFLLKPPREMPGELSDRMTENVDVLPTMAQVLNETLPFVVDGVSVLDDSAPEREERRYWQQNRMQEVQQRAFSGGNFEGMAAALKHKLERFGAGADQLLLTWSPKDEWVGQTVEALNALPVEDGWRVELDAGNPRELVQTSAPSALPLTGRVVFDSQTQAEPWMAVASNGVIVNVTRTHAVSPGRSSFLTFLPGLKNQGLIDELKFFVSRDNGDPSVWRELPVKTPNF